MSEATEFISEIKLGALYSDEITGISGTATQIAFLLDGTQQVLLEAPNAAGDDIVRTWLDVTRVLQ